MSQLNLRHYEEMLHARCAELQGPRRLDAIVVERVADELDSLRLAVDREIAITNLNRETALLNDIRQALSRIADGTYGFCERCEDEIGTKRLNALPWARYCLKCQEAADRENGAGTTIQLAEVA